MSYIENLTGNIVQAEVQEILALGAGNFKIREFNIINAGDNMVLSNGIAIIDGLRVKSTGDLHIPVLDSLGKYIFLRINTYVIIKDGKTVRKADLSLLAQDTNASSNVDDLYYTTSGTKDILLAYINSVGEIDLSTPGAIGFYDVPSRILDLENDIKSGQSKGYWASYFDTTTQVSNLVVKPVEYNSTYFQYGITCVDKTKIRFGQKGTYNIQFSFEVKNEINSEQIADFWFRLNGTYLANTNTRVTLLKQANTIASWNFVLDANIGDELQIMWYAPSGVILKTYPAETLPNRPLVPSTIITITQVLYNQKGIPSGGTTGQVLSKVDGADYNVKWVTRDTSSLETRMTAVETKNTTQDTRLTNIESKNTTQDTSITSLTTRATNIETKNTQQDTRLTNIETKNTTQDTSITSLTTRVTNVETKNTVQDSRLTDLEIEVANLIGVSIFDKIYPIGSIYMSSKPNNPSESFGGTWIAWGTGRVPIGVDTSQTEFNTVEKTGGSKTNTLVANNIPVHTHPISLESSTSTINATISSVALSTYSAGEHSHQPIENSGTKNYFVTSSGSTRSTGVMDYTASENAVSVPGIASKSNQFSATNGTGDAGAHTHTIASHNHALTDSVGHSHTVSGSTGNNTTTTTAVNNLPPYITCYMWKRTA